MTVLSTTNTISSTANGVDVDFPFNFKVNKESHMKVYFDGVEQLSGWSIDPADLGSPTGGDVTFSVAPTINTVVDLVRVVPLTQAVDYTIYDAFPDTVHEKVLDEQTMMDQQQQEELDRSPKFALNESPAGGVALPAPENFKAIGYDGSGNLANLEVGGGGELVVNPLSSALKDGGFSFQLTDGGDPAVVLGELRADVGDTKVELTATTELLLTSPLVTVSATLDATTLKQGGATIAALIDADIATHEAAGDPHPGYLLESVVAAFIKNNLLDDTSAEVARATLECDVTVTSVALNTTPTDASRGIVYNCTADLTLNPAASTVGNDWYIGVKANGGNATITPSVGQVDGGASTVFSNGESGFLYCDGTNFWTIKGGASGGGGGGNFKGENGEVGAANSGDIFRVHEQTLDTNVTIDADENALCVGPLTIASGVTLTVNGNLTIV